MGKLKSKAPPAKGGVSLERALELGAQPKAKRARDYPPPNRKVPLDPEHKRPETRTATPQPVKLTLTRINEGGDVQTLLDFTVLTDDSDRAIGMLNAGLTIRHTIKRAP